MTDGIPEDVMADVYTRALRHAEIMTQRRGSDELSELALDAATNAIMWSRDNFDPSKATGTGFRGFAMQAVRVSVARAIAGHFRRDRPVMQSLDTELEDGRRSGDAVEGGAEVERLTIADLDEELAFIVRLYMIDGFTLRDIGLLIGCGAEAVRRKIHHAAELLAPGRIKPTRRNGERKLRRAGVGERA